MILRDRVNITRTGERRMIGTPPKPELIVERLPRSAHVTHRASEVQQDGLRAPWTQRWSLTVILNPEKFELDPYHHGIEWRGDHYAILAPPIVKRRGHRDHHWIIEISREAAT